MLICDYLFIYIYIYIYIMIIKSFIIVIQLNVFHIFSNPSWKRRQTPAILAKLKIRCV